MHSAYAGLCIYHQGLLPGLGTITVNNVLLQGGVFEYALDTVYTGRTLRPYQTSNEFTGVREGLYRVRVRQVCGNGVYSAAYVIPSVYISSVVSPLQQNSNNNFGAQGYGPTDAACTNGKIYMSAPINGSGNYAYALVPSLNEPEPLSNYVSTPRASNSSLYAYDSAQSGVVFDSLAAGTIMYGYTMCAIRLCIVRRRWICNRSTMQGSFRLFIPVAIAIV